METNENEKRVVIDLTEKFMATQAGWPSKLGRYSCSKIHSMLEGSKLPWGCPVNKYFTIEEPNFTSAMRMSKGTRAHEFVQKFLDPSKCERKYIYNYYGHKDPRNGTTPAQDENGVIVAPIFVVVAKVDYIPDDSVWEIKSSDDVFSKPKDYHTYQAKLYTSICDRPLAMIFQPLETEERFFLAQVGESIPRDDEWFDGEMQKLHAYHQRLELLVADQERIREQLSGSSN